MKNSSMAWAVKAALIPLQAALAVALMPGHASAQTPVWRVVAGENSNVIAPDLPTGTFRDLTDVYVGDVGRDLFAFRVNSPTALEGYWAQRGGKLVRYTQRGNTGTLGPGRGGAEANHVFLDINSGWGGASPDGQRNFLARAGDPAATLNASYGLWRWNGSSNIEVARGSSDGILGPGLGANWVFHNNSGFATARMLNDGKVLMYADVDSPTGADSTLLALHVPGQGNLPCARSGATEPALAPGLTAGDYFLTISSGISRFSVNRAGEIFGRMPVSGSRSGIFELCDGAPRAVAVDYEIGPRGPDLGAISAEFTDFSTRAPQPSGNDKLVYFADWRTTGQSSRTGLFQFDGVANRGIAYREDSGYYGPNWLDSTWRVFNSDTLSVAHDYSAFVAGLDTPDGGDPTGLWRVHAGDRPQLVALIGLTIPAYQPEAGRTWRTFEQIVVLSNGDILVQATTNPNSTRDLWLLRDGEAPRRILSPGTTTVTVQTTTGAVQVPVSGFDAPNDGADYNEGADRWVGADGTLYLSVSTSNYGRLLITTALDVPNPDIIFSGDFE